MSTQVIRDYLTKQLLIESNVVTYRSLSRAQSLHVNVAKNELAEFHATEGQGLFATYLLCGQTTPPPPPKRVNQDIDMDDNPYIDEEDLEDQEEYIPESEIVLVPEKDLESAQARFVTLESVHIYSLSPSVLRDPDLLCAPTQIVRSLDAKKGAELASTVGKVVAANVTWSNKPLPPWGGRKDPPPIPGSSKVAPKKQEVKKEDTKGKEKEKAAPEKPKPTGKLDFSKAKTKPLAKKEEEKKPIKAEPKASTISEKVQTKMVESKKRGTKRKSALASDSEDEEVKPKPVAKPAKPAAKAESSVHVRKGVVLSDDEDDAPKPDRKGKGKAVSKAEKDLHAMMDIDDDAVTRASRDVERKVEEEEEEEPEDQPMEDVQADLNAKPAPAKRKPKKVIPVGKNGLKKKRIVKSRHRIDEKGYMVMEDYSEYESVDEEEPPPPAKGKAKAKSTETAAPKAKAKPEAAKPKPDPKPAAAPSKPKPKPSGASVKGGQPTVASFFGKAKSKSKE